jgi:hypothetical protein
MQTVTFIIVASIILLVVLNFMTGYDLKRTDNKYENVQKQLAVTADAFWFTLTLAQQAELKNQKTFMDQEKWVERHGTPKILMSTSTEKLVVELANNNRISLGSGNPRRLTSVVDEVLRERRQKEKEAAERLAKRNSISLQRQGRRRKNEIQRKDAELNNRKRKTHSRF